MKRIFTLLLAALAITLTACSVSRAPAPPNPTTAATEPAASPTEPAPQDVISLTSRDDVAVSVTNIRHNEHTGMELQLRCVNKTQRTLLFSWDMVSVCGYMYDPMWAVEVAPGKTSNSTATLDTHELEEMGVPSVDEITFTLRVVDSENWMDEPVLEQIFTIYPTGLSAESLVLPERAPAAGQVVIADDENIRFVIEGAEDDSSYKLRVFLENKTGRNLMYAWDKVSVNGFMVDPLWAVSVAAGKKACSEILFARSDFENNGITEVSQIEFTLQVSDYDNWAADYLLNETFTYKP